MNIDRNLVARALVKAGEEPITDDEWTEGTSNRVRVVKDFYLASLLESLASYDWTSQKKRAKLEFLYKEVDHPKKEDQYSYFILDENEHYAKAYRYDAVNKTSIPQWDPTLTYYVIDNDDNLTEFAYMYPLPADCAKVISVNDDKPYIVEGAFLFCDEENAVLLYIKNYFTGKYVFAEVENPDPDDISKYYEKDEHGNYVKAEQYVMGTTYYVIVEHDYNFYDQPQLDPTLSAYFECKLAAAIALKLTGGADKYQMLYNEAQFIANNAMKKSAEQARNKTKGNEWWTHQLGLD